MQEKKMSTASQDDHVDNAHLEKTEHYSGDEFGFDISIRLRQTIDAIIQNENKAQYVVALIELTSYLEQLKSLCTDLRSAGKMLGRGHIEKMIFIGLRRNEYGETIDELEYELGVPDLGRWLLRSERKVLMSFNSGMYSADEPKSIVENANMEGIDRATDYCRMRFHELLKKQ